MWLCLALFGVLTCFVVNFVPLWLAYLLLGLVVWYLFNVDYCSLVLGCCVGCVWLVLVDVSLIVVGLVVWV